MKPVSSASVLPATVCSTVFEWPPARSSRSNSSTSWPFRSAYAAPSPEMPVPITAILIVIPCTIPEQTFDMLGPDGPLPHDDPPRSSASRGVRLHGRLRQRSPLGPERERGQPDRRGADRDRLRVRPRRALRRAGRAAPLRYRRTRLAPTGRTRGAASAIRLEGHHHG